jgi:hypothetical protein
MDVRNLEREETRPLINFPRFVRCHAILHELWSAAAVTYDKNRDKPRWMELEAAIGELARLGLGEPAPAVSDLAQTGASRCPSCCRWHASGGSQEATCSDGAARPFTGRGP